jgi:hypothetical protein
MRKFLFTLVALLIATPAFAGNKLGVITKLDTDQFQMMTVAPGNSAQSKGKAKTKGGDLVTVRVPLGTPIVSASDESVDLTFANLKVGQTVRVIFEGRPEVTNTMILKPTAIVAD